MAEIGCKEACGAIADTTCDSCFEPLCADCTFVLDDGAEFCRLCLDDPHSSGPDTGEGE